MEKNKKVIGGLASLVIIAIIAIVVLLVQNGKFKKEITAEKEALTMELDSTKLSFEQIKISRDSLSQAYNVQSEDFQSITYQFEDSQLEIENLQLQLEKAKGSYRTISTLRRQLKSLKNEIKKNNESFLSKMDSIKSVNDSLQIVIVETKTELNQEKLHSQELVLKLSEATKIQITDVTVYAVKESKSGYKQTSRSRKADAFKVEYSVLNNKALRGEETDMFYVLKGVDGKIINPTGEFSFKIEFYSLDGLLSKRVVTLKSGIF